MSGFKVDRRLMDAPMRRVRRIHLVGIGGSGMAGIAEVLLNLGYDVTGSDLQESATVKRLAGLGARIERGHTGALLDDADVVVVSTAITPDNPELQRAQQRRLPVVRRAEMLAELMRFRYGIAIAGTHGKTTTTSLVAAVLADGGLDPTFIVGGRVKSAGTNARLGAGEYLVAEADDSDASFLHLTPMMAVVTNIDADHLETYGGDFRRLQQTFIEFLHQLPFYGLVVACIDDPVVRELAPAIGRPMRTYGYSEDADIRIGNWQADASGARFTLADADGEIGAFHLSLPGRHNTLNATAAAVIGIELGLPVEAIQSALSSFEGIGRRCEPHGVLRLGAGRAELIDDYGHHPREIEATLRALRDSYPGRRIVVVFQPHRYSRTRDLFEDFCQVLSDTDVLVLGEVYAAGETPVADADGRALARGIRARGGVEPVFVARTEDLPAELERLVEDGDLVLTLGAGDIGRLPAELVARYGEDS